MRIIAHISDLRCGESVPQVAEALKADLSQIRPALVVVSGDVTRSGGRKQFQSAKAFLEAIPFPRLVVPGDRDAPVHSLWRRLRAPWRYYEQSIGSSVSAWFHDDELAVWGMNTARPLAWKRGWISYDQINSIKVRLCPIPESKFKVVVTHHPLVPPRGAPKSGVHYLGSRLFVGYILQMARVDLLLSGHLHARQPGSAQCVCPMREDTFVSVQSGRALGPSGRGRPTAYHQILLKDQEMVAALRVWDGSQFTEQSRKVFRCAEEGWQEE